MLVVWWSGALLLLHDSMWGDPCLFIYFLILTKILKEDGLSVLATSNWSPFGFYSTHEQCRKKRLYIGLLKGITRRLIRCCVLWAIYAHWPKLRLDIIKKKKVLLLVTLIKEKYMISHCKLVIVSFHKHLTPVVATTIIDLIKIYMYYYYYWTPPLKTYMSMCNVCLI